jgi:hypothetical protein
MSRQPESQRKGISDQGKQFVDAARGLECDESEERFDAALKRLRPTSQPRRVKNPHTPERTTANVSPIF